jgi:pyrroline-5-carboxylate reductase
MKTKTEKATVFLGGGRITNALVAGLRLAKYDKPILVHDRNPGKLRQLKKQYGVAVEPSLQKAVKEARLLLIAVRPDFKTASTIGTTCTLGTSYAQSCVPQRARTHGFDFRLNFLSHRKARR